ncbi:MAG: hypothetical protein KF866_00710 [Phycisphaeraceae bacterium]|nr:hypothetical protein [Phycisphaeraceae bacterium]
MIEPNKIKSRCNIEKNPKTLLLHHLFRGAIGLNLGITGLKCPEFARVGNHQGFHWYENLSERMSIVVVPLGTIRTHKNAAAAGTALNLWAMARCPAST